MVSVWSKIEGFKYPKMKLIECSKIGQSIGSVSQNYPRKFHKAILTPTGELVWQLEILGAPCEHVLGTPYKMSWRILINCLEEWYHDNKAGQKYTREIALLILISKTSFQLSLLHLLPYPPTFFPFSMFFPFPSKVQQTKRKMRRNFYEEEKSTPHTFG